MSSNRLPSNASTASKRVSVLVRVRPALPRELDSSSFVSAVAVVPDQSRVFVSVEDKPVLISGADSSELPEHVRSFQLDAALGSEASQDDVVEALGIRQEASAVLRGVNATILAYGQTGSGKTYTMGTEGDSQGLVARAADALFSSSGGDVEVYATYLQLYRDTITDLLSTSGDSCKLREVEGKFQVAGLRQVAVQSAEDVCSVLAEGAARRMVACTKLNATSSRSHAVLTLHVSCELEADQFSQAQWTFVDLAGSERVKESGVAGEALKEACSINSSLNALINVVRALREGGRAVVPYRDHKLTMILREAIGGNSATWLVATASPAQLHGRETSNTLGFAVACASIQNTIVANVAQRSAPWREPPPKAKQRESKTQVPWESAAKPVGNVVLLDTPLRQISVTIYGEGAPAVLLHGYPSDASSWTWLVPALMHSGYQAIAIDMPGCGHSPGPELKTHSRFNHEKGGACEVVCATLDALGLKRATFIGYDWGAGIVLSLGIGWRTRCERLVAFHPSYNVIPGGELSRIRMPILVVWVKEDQFHPLSVWKKIARDLPNDVYEFEVFSAGPNRKFSGYGLHPVIGCKIQARIATFLGWVDAGSGARELAKRLEQASSSTSGERVVEQRNVVLAEQLQDADIVRSLTERSSSEVAAVHEFCLAMEAGHLKALYAQAPASLFGALPKLSPEVLRQNIEVLLHKGLWTSLPGNWDTVMHSPRYFVGRQVLVRTKVCPFPASESYMKADVNGKILTTHRATIWSLSEGSATVDIDGGISQVVSSEELLALNQPHLFREERQTVCLEDGLKCNYSRPLTKAKMVEIALRLAPLVEDFDFGDPLSAEVMQLRCIGAVRECLDIVSFQRGLDRSRVCSMCDDAARFAVNGQGHCHTVSSVMCAFLYPWAELLGIDLCYRGGFSFASVNPDDGEVFRGEVADNPERHQWLEVCLRPRMSRYVVDLWVEDGSMGAAALRWPAEEAYQRRMYPHCQLRLGQRPMPPTCTDWEATL